MREQEAELAAQEGALLEAQAGAEAAEAAGEHQATLQWQAKQAAAQQVRDRQGEFYLHAFLQPLAPMWSATQCGIDTPAFEFLCSV